MLKKAGIVVATAAACLLAVSPLAFAGEYDGDNGGGDDGDGGRNHSKSDDPNCDQDNSSSHKSKGRGGDDLISISNNSIQVPIQACGNDVLSGTLGVLNFGDQKNKSNDR